MNNVGTDDLPTGELPPDLDIIGQGDRDVVDPDPQDGTEEKDSQDRNREEDDGGEDEDKDSVSLVIRVDFDPNDIGELDTLRERIEGLKGVKEVEDHPDTEKLFDELVSMSNMFSIDSESYQTNEELADKIEDEIQELLDKGLKSEECNELLREVGERTHQMAGHQETPQQRVCRDISERIGLRLNINYSVHPQLGRDTELPGIWYDEKEKPKNPDGPDVGIWVEDPGDAEETEQVAVIAEYLKGVERAKRLP